MDWDSLGPISLALTAASAVVGGAIKWIDAVRQRRRDQMIKALEYRLAAEEKDHAEDNAEAAEKRVALEAEREQYREAYFSARATLRSYERQLLAAGITPEPHWEEPDV